MPYDNPDTNLNNSTVGSLSNSPQFKSTLSPVDANKTALALRSQSRSRTRSRTRSRSRSQEEKVKEKENKQELKNITPMEREVSVSKSRSRQFRPREEPKPPNGKPIQNTSNSATNEPPEIDDDNHEDDRASNASSLSDNVEIPVLLFSDSGDEDDVMEDDENLKMMQYLVEKENERLEKEILKMKSYVDEQETIRLKKEAFQEIQAEAMKNQTNDDEEEKKRKALERYEKKARQRQKEKEEAKERRKREKEEKKKRKKALALKRKMAKRQKERVKKREKSREQRKKELEEFDVNEEKPTREQIINMFDKYFYKPFEAQKSNPPKHQKHKTPDLSDDSSSSDEEEQLPEGGINFNGFKAGLKALGIDKILTKQEIEDLFDHMTESSREYGINAVDFVYFLQQNAITLQPKLAIIQRKIISTLAKQQDKEDEMEKKIMKQNIEQNGHKQDEHNGAEQEQKEDGNGNGDGNENENENGHEQNQTLIRIPTLDSDKEQEPEQEEEPKHKEKEVDVSEIGDVPKMIIQISEPVPRPGDKKKRRNMNTTATVTPAMTPQTSRTEDEYKVQDIIRPMDSILDEHDTDTEDGEDDDLGSLHHNQDSRRTSVSMSESMSMSVSQFGNLPPNIPRKSFKAINYNWNDSISKKSFNNYKRLREKFAFRYKHTPKRTKDEELLEIREQLLNEAINTNIQNKDNDNDKPNDNESENNEIEEKHEEKQDDIANDTANDNEQKQENIQTKSPSQHNRGRSGSKRKGSISRSALADINELDDMDEKKQIEQRSAVTSLKKIQDYKGNQEMNDLRKLYRKQYKMKQKIERLRKRSLLNFPAPPKPKNVEEYMDEHTKYICKELKLCICKNTRYTGLANFEKNGELGVEIEFTSDCDENGYLTGKRVIHFKGMKQAIGRGRIWLDLAWNGNKYCPCTKFEWIDEGEGVTTKFEFNSVQHEIDVDHSFFKENVFDILLI